MWSPRISKNKPSMASLIRSLNLWSLALILATVVGEYGSVLGGGYSPSSMKFQPTQWSLAHATFYGDETASETMGTIVVHVTTILISCFYRLHCLFAMAFFVVSILSGRVFKYFCN